MNNNACHVRWFMRYFNSSRTTHCSFSIFLLIIKIYLKNVLQKKNNTSSDWQTKRICLKSSYTELLFPSHFTRQIDIWYRIVQRLIIFSHLWIFSSFLTLLPSISPYLFADTEMHILSHAIRMRPSSSYGDIIQYVPSILDMLFLRQ